jgi:N-ATPase, AtpR subunit
MTRTLLVQLALFGGAGFALGIAHFVTLRANVRLYVAPGPVWRPIALNLLRLGMTVAAFAAAVVCGGAIAVLAGLVGFLLARTVLVRAAWSGT